MNIHIQATNMELTPAIRDYVEKKVSMLDKFISASDESVKCEVEVGKTTHHHKQGDYFRAEIKLHVAGRNHYTVSEKDDLYAAIDEVKDEMASSLTTHKEKKETLFRKGAARVKDMLKGFDWRNR
jgi:putative sigma-54 modulation protein